MCFLRNSAPAFSKDVTAHAYSPRKKEAETEDHYSQPRLQIFEPTYATE